MLFHCAACQALCRKSSDFPLFHTLFGVPGFGQALPWEMGARHLSVLLPFSSPGTRPLLTPARVDAGAVYPSPPSLSRKADGFFSSFRISGPSCLLGQRTASLRWLADLGGSSCVHLVLYWQTWANARYGSAPASWRNRVFSLQ